MLVLRGFALLFLFLDPRFSLTSAAPGRAHRGGDRASVLSSGKFSNGDNTQCTWNARNAGVAVVLRVTCSVVGINATSCEYTAKPQSCPGFLSDPKGFWKQLGRALRRMKGKLCEDKRALIKVGMCKSAPRDAHFKLDARGSPTVTEPRKPSKATAPPALRTTSTAPTACAKRADHTKTAEEYCGSSWTSLCAFFFSMLQSEDC
ncbi:fibroblast growth factor-binding protein 1 [Oryzias melastigma]|uniref:Fibroblast growth factor binding protein 1b n=1 Tax=Oryzias melastigma TaxID=30732 RepID=A0A3B3B8K6_ORYME|nr:fibroblast growth factor-binding protein 1 [Oryzias melastigma]